MTDTEITALLKDINTANREYLQDGTTFRIEGNGLEEVNQKITREIVGAWPSKVLVLTDGAGVAIGAVVFYGSMNLEIFMLPEYRGKGYMSALHKNGILKSELYANQKVWHDMDYPSLPSLDALKMHVHLLRYLGLALNPADLDMMYLIMHYAPRFHGLPGYDKESFINEFSR